MITNKNLFFLRLSFCLYLFIGCKSAHKTSIKDYEFDKIIFEEKNLESFTILQITKDSVIYSAGTFSPKSEKISKKRNTIESWKTFTSSISISDFDKIKSNKDNPYVKDSFVSITLQVGKKKHYYQNGVINEIINPNMYNFISLIESQLGRCAF